MREIFKNRMVVLTGIGRSGTSLIGKIVGSMNPVFFLFEPAITKFMGEFAYNETFNRILFEDYFLNIIHGRVNTNSLDDSSIENYETLTETCWRRVHIGRRSDALDYIKMINPIWCIKHTEFQYNFEYAQSHWPGVRYITVFRNGKDVVVSALSRGWFSNDWCNNDIVEPTYRVKTIKIPRYIISQPDAIMWEKWNPATRAACVWRTLNAVGIEYKKQNPNKVFQFRYEDFCKKPVMSSKKIADWLGVEITDLTSKHINDIHDPPSHNFDIKEIMEPERTKFLNLNRRLEYRI